MRVALIHDWLVAMRGGERCLEIIQNLYPDSEIFTLFYDADAVSEQIRQSQVHCSVLGKLPWVNNYYRCLLPIYPLGAKNISKKIAAAHAVQPFDLVISISHCVAKNVVLPKEVPHLCYCLTPVRYVWDQYDAYFKGRIYEPLTKIVAKWFRSWDVSGASGVTSFIAISDFVASRISKYYGRESTVIYPPIDTTLFNAAGSTNVEDIVDRATALSEEDTGNFLCVNALVPYKNTHVVIEAFSDLPQKLIVVGSGPELRRLKKIATANVEFRGTVPLKELCQLYKSSKALIFAAEEDFGMTPVEIQASGRPVIAFAKGGVLETVDSEKTGVFFSELSANAIKEAVLEFTSREQQFSVDNCLRQAQKFCVAHFMQGFEQQVQLLLRDVSPIKQRSHSKRDF